MCDLKKNDKCRECVVVFVVCLITSLGLIIAGFVVPPTGVIDGSVLTAVGEIIAFPAIAFGMRAIELGYDAKITHNNTTIELGNETNED